MIDEKIVKDAEKRGVIEGLVIAKEKQKIVEESFKIIKLASIKTNQGLDEKVILEKLYVEVKNIDNKKIKQIFNNKNKEKLENEIIEEIIKKVL